MADKNIRFRVNGYSRYNDDGKFYTAHCSDLKLDTYGNTRNIAVKRMQKALQLWADTLGDNDLLSKRLTGLRIPFTKNGDSIPETSCWTLETAGVGQ